MPVGPRIIRHQGKGGGQQVLPSRHALNTLTRGDPMDRTMNNYAKASPLNNPVAEAADPGITDMPDPAAIIRRR